MQPIYLDHAATTPVRPEVREAMAPFLSERFGNPSSLHGWGRSARAALEEARARLAASIGAAPRDIVFTRGGTESDGMAVLGRSRRERAAPVVCSSVEHRAVLASARAAESEGSPVGLLPVRGDGRVDPAALDEWLPRGPSVVSVMWVNNEIGAVQPVAELADRCVAAGVPFHTDAVQAVGKLPVRVDRVPVALLSLSGHKIYGPKGTGALFVRRGVELAPLLFGGGQERGLRAGTEDVAGAVGLALAVELAQVEQARESARLAALRDRLEAALRQRVPHLAVNGPREAEYRSPAILNVSFPGADPELLLAGLDVEGVAASSGSACSSGAVTPSHVLTAMGLGPERAGPSVRFSLGRATSDEEIDRAAAAAAAVVERMAQMR